MDRYGRTMVSALGLVVLLALRTLWLASAVCAMLLWATEVVPWSQVCTPEF